MATIIDLGERRTERAVEREWAGLTNCLAALAAEAAAPIRFQIGDRVQLRDGAQRPDWYDSASAAGEVWGEIAETPYGNRRAVGAPVFNVRWHRWVPARRDCGGCVRFDSGSTERHCFHHARWSTELAWYMSQDDLETYAPTIAR